MWLHSPELALGSTFQMATLGPGELRVSAQAHRAGKQQPWGLNPHQLCCKAQTTKLYGLAFPPGSIRTEVIFTRPLHLYVTSSWGCGEGAEALEVSGVLCKL